MEPASDTNLTAWRLERQGGYAHWRAPVVLMAHLDAPVDGGLVVEGNLRVEGWAFRVDGEGEPGAAQLELHSQGQRLAVQALAVERADVNETHGLPAGTAPLGFRFLLDDSWPGPELQVVVRLNEGHCTLARLWRTPAGAGLERWLERALRAGPQVGGGAGQPAQPSWSWVLEQLQQGGSWDGSERAPLQRLKQGLERDLGLLGQGLDPTAASSAAAGSARALLALLARRYGLGLLGALMAGVNRHWLAERQLEFGQHGPQRTFRFWSTAEKQWAMAASSEALRCWQAAGIPCFHSFGTLLGLVREGDLLAHDDDIDAVALVPVAAEETPEQAVAGLERRLRQLGHATEGDYRFHRHVQHDGLWFDLFVATVRDGEVTFWGTRIWTTRLERLLPLQTLQLGGLSCVLPGDPEHVVEGIYGRGWRTPRPYHYTAIERALGSGSHSAARISQVELPCRAQI
jgi:hypothetical protein